MDLSDEDVFLDWFEIRVHSPYKSIQSVVSKVFKSQSLYSGN